jgi:flavodoxin
MKALVVYYSLTGHTRTVAEAIAELLSCDREEIVDTQKRSGPIGFLRSGMQAKRKSLIHIKDLKKDVSEYDVVIIGTPVWAGTVSSPVRTFVHNYKDELNKVAFFSTHGGDESQEEFSEMEHVCGSPPVCTLSLASREVEGEDYIKKVKDFVSNLEKKATRE